MANLKAFHDILFPLDLGYCTSKSIIRKAEIINFISGNEQRNGRKYHSKRRYEIGLAPSLFSQLTEICEFYEARRGPLVAFKWHDKLDYKSCKPDADITAMDQNLGQYDGSNNLFQLQKKYGEDTDQDQNYYRNITKPKLDSLSVAVNGNILASNSYSLDVMSGKILINALANLNIGDEISAGFEFDVMVRFEQQSLDIDYKAYSAGEILCIPIVEILE